MCSLLLQCIFTSTNTLPNYQLLAFGIASWNLSANEIINLALRHKDRLKGLRLRDIHLNEGSMWRDVLGTLRSRMLNLEWVSLRRIGYMRGFEEMNGEGAEIPDDPMFGISTSGSDEGDDESEGGTGEEHMPGANNLGDQLNGGFSEGEDSDGHAHSDDDEHGPEANATEFPDLNPIDSPTVATWPNGTHRSFPDSVEDLGDNGYSVSYRQRKAWEKWVVGG